MSARFQHTLRMIGKQIHHWKIAQLPALSSDQRTRLTWARMLNSYESVPDVYKEFFRPYLAKGLVFPYSVLTPAYEARGQRITEKVICKFDDEIQILERDGKALAVQCYPVSGISFVEVSSMLLDSRIKINGVTSLGIPASCIVRFSTISDYLFTPILRKIRLYRTASAPSGSSSTRETFEHWVHLNYKLMNLARNSLVEGEQVICAILAPEIRRNMFTILGKTYSRTISPTHASILTDRELILIREEVLQGREDKYGGIWEYIPLSKIADLSMSRKSDHLLAVSIQLLTKEHFECVFPPSKENEVDQLLDMFRKMRSN